MALVGLSGSGKSSFLKLLLGLVNIQEGEILIGNQSIKDLSLEQRSHLFSYVPQSPFLFNETIKENICLHEKFDLEKYNLVKKISCLDEFIESLEQKDLSIVGAKGSQISGGQAQRIVLARALYQDRDILILDEGTSALDNVLDYKIQEELLLLDKTIINVSHRLNSVKNYDEIYYLQDGKIMEHGSHEDLIAKNSFYKKLYSFQEKSPN